ncbi:hypothetical protein LBMAG42_50650 [Deltaproteobacteria bacterium]|nr:hypothetical protein LBMAG42_50650 [Deltaproteobacteria bacterium]
MTDVELTQTLASFGVDAASRQALVLLPVVWVAWADGSIHPEERTIILEIARTRLTLGPEGERVLENWLSFVPAPERVERAAAALVALDMRGGSNHEGDVVDLCRKVAQAAGPFFGRIGTPEREAIETVAASLAVEPHQALDTLRARLVVESQAPLDEWFDEERTNPLGISPSRAQPSQQQPPPKAGPVGLAWRDSAGEANVELVTRIDVGRGRDNDLQLAHDGQLSRHHATFERRPEGVYILDRGTLNGVVVDGERVKERRLFGGEVVVLGETVFRWRG